MAGPLVALTTYPADEESNRYGLPHEYVDAVLRAGGDPLLVPPGVGDLDRVLAVADAIVFTGGGDFDPATYGGQPHETVYMTNPTRDASELALCRAAIDADVPTLCICRGLQTLNIARGGSLHEHLPDVFGDAVAHRIPPRSPVPHPVKVEPDSLVADVMGETEPTPMSWHHQAVALIGDGLRITASAPDGVVEALELEGHRWLVAVQWHPELTAATDPSQQAFFDHLAEAARR